MNLHNKYAHSLLILLALLLILGVLASCAPQPAAPEETAAVPEGQAVVSGTPLAEPPAGGTPVPEDSAEAVPGEVKEVATAVAARTPVPSPTPGQVDREIAEITSELGLSGKSFLGISVEGWFDIGISILIVFIGYFLGVRLLAFILKWIANHTAVEFDEFLLVKLAPDLKWLVVLFFVRFAFLRLDFISDEARTTFQDIFFGLGLVIIITLGIRTISQFAEWYKNNLKSDDEDIRLTPVIMSVQRFASLVFLVFMLSFGLSHFGVNLGALSITILVLAVVVSLGAKDVITDAISGFVILLDQPFRVHDGIQIKELDAWGDVLEIGTRTTRILTRDNREVIIPNTKLLNSQVVNYTYPDPTSRMQVDLRIAYSSDLDQAIQVIMDALKKVDGVLPDKDVEVLFVGFGGTARQIRVRWWIADYHQDYAVLNEVCKVIDSALNREGIDIPITTYDLNVRMQDGQTASGDVEI